MDNEMMQFCNDLLESVRQMKSGESARKTELVPLADGRVRRLITRADGTIEQCLASIILSGSRQLPCPVFS